MNIIYHHRTRCRGAEGVHIRGIQKAFVRRGYRIIDISLVKANQPNEVEIKNEVSLKKRCFSFICDVLPNSIFKILEIVYSFRAIIVGFFYIKKNHKIEFIYDRYAYFSFAMPFLGKLLNIPLILEVNTTCLDYDVRQIKFKFLAKKIERYCYENSSIIVVVSNYLKEKICNNYNVESDKIVITPNAVDPKDFLIDVPVEGNDFPLLFSNLRESSIVIGFVGVFVPWHGIEFLIDIFRRLVAHFEESFDLTLILVGDGPIKSSVEASVADDPALRDRVLFTGMVPHDAVKYYIETFDIAVMPDSNPFGSPMKIFEYMIMGRAILAPSYPPIVEVIDSGFNGLLFKEKNHNECFSRLQSLIKDEELRLQLGINAKKIAEKEHTWAANVEKILNIFDHVNSH